MFHLLSHPRYQEVSKSQEKPAVLLILEYAKQSEVPLSLQYRCLTNTESSFIIFTYGVTTFQSSNGQCILPLSAKETIIKYMGLKALKTSQEE